MGTFLQVSSNFYDEARIDALTRQLLRELRVDTDPTAALVKQSPDKISKGECVSLGQIALALVTSGAVTTLIRCIFDFLAKNKKAKLLIKKPDGAALEIDAEFIDSKGAEKTSRLISDFLENGR